MPPEAPPKKKKSPPKQLRVAFDSNVLHTATATDLVRQEVGRFIQEAVYPDLKIFWYLPSIVRHERQFQMQKKGLELLPSILAMERLLEHGLNITAQLVIEQVQ